MGEVNGQRSPTNVAGNPSVVPGIYSPKPKFPKFASFCERMESFGTWPEHLPLQPKCLAEAGFGDTGMGGKVRCYHCGWGLRDWRSGHDPWQEHARQYRICPHVLLEKDKGYVDVILRGGKPRWKGVGDSVRCYHCEGVFVTGRKKINHGRNTLNGTRSVPMFLV